MPIDVLNQLDIIAAMEDYLEAVRPPLHLRDEVDVGYKIENTSIIIFEIRPSFRDEAVILEQPIAKATYTKKTNLWKIFWFKSDMKWHTYKTDHEIKNVKDFIAVVEEDKHACFWG